MKRLIDNIELIGRMKGDGYKEPFYLIRTPKKKFIQLSELLYDTVLALKVNPDETAVAACLSKLQNKEVDVQAVRYIIEKKLEPLGIITDSNAIYVDKKTEESVHAPSMLHSLRFRITLIPEKFVPFIASFYTPLFHKRVIFSVIASFALLDIWLFGFHGIAQGLRQAVYEPFLFLLVMGLMMLSTLFHEIGHAAGALTGGSTPGKIGAGIYLIWPAFYTDITDVYRLGRKDRLRSDFGGVYFNMIYSLIVGLVYIFTRFEPLLLLIFLQNTMILHQLLPFLRLDGYFIVSDFVGVPDLFTRIKPILSSVFLRRENNATHDLKPWVKWVVIFWVITVMPILALLIGIMLMNAPGIIMNAWNSAGMHSAVMKESFQSGNYFITFVRALQLIILMLPAFGVCMMLYLLGKPLVHKIRNLNEGISIIRMPQIVSQKYP